MDDPRRPRTPARVAAAAIALSAAGARADVPALRPLVAPLTLDGEVAAPLRALRLTPRPEGGLVAELLDGDGRVLSAAAAESRRWFLPGFGYRPASPPDRFDAFNLRMREFARAGVRLRARAGAAPGAGWGEPDSSRSDRGEGGPGGGGAELQLTNNCLASGLWEVKADLGAERVHAWARLPPDGYLSWAAEATGLRPGFLREALAWSEERVRPEMGRLRRVVRSHGEARIRLDPGYAFRPETAEEVRKFGADHVSCRAGVAAPPAAVGDLARPVYFKDFLPPGRYSAEPVRAFDLGFLLRPGTARLFEVAPETVNAAGRPPPADRVHVEVTLELGEYRVCVGNLPLGLLDEETTLRIHGFGVGVPEALADPGRRRRRDRAALAPTYAYVMEAPEDGGRVLNSHTLGLETVWVGIEKTPGATNLVVTLGAFERVVELARYRVPLPEPLAWRLDRL